MSMFNLFARRLLRATDKCKDDMHEPDEQDVSAVVTGTHLDNAMGDDPYHNCLEFTVGIRDDLTGDIEWFNLANLIAVARVGALYLNGKPNSADKLAEELRSP